MRRHVNILWSIVLFGAALVVLLHALGVVPEGVYDLFVRSLPALLVFAGLSLILPTRIPLGGFVALIITGLLIAGLTVTAFSNQGDQLQDDQQEIIAQEIGEEITLVQINIETLNTDIELRATEGDSITGNFTGSTESLLTVDYREELDGRATFTFREALRNEFPVLDAIGRGVLELGIPSDRPVAIAFEGGDGSALFDMSNIALERLALQLDSGNLGVTLPEYMPQSPNAPDQPGIIIADDGDVTIFVPEDVAARFELNRRGSGIEPRFDDDVYLYLVGDVLESRDFEDADLQLRYEVTAPDGQIILETVP